MIEHKSTLPYDICICSLEELKLQEQISNKFDHTLKLLDDMEKFYKGISKYYSSFGRTVKIHGSATVSLLGKLQEQQLFSDQE